MKNKKKPKYVIIDLITGHYYKSIGWRHFNTNLNSNNQMAYKAIFVPDINDATVIPSSRINGVKSWFSKYIIINKYDNNRIYYPADICEKTVKIVTILDP